VKTPHPASGGPRRLLTCTHSAIDPASRFRVLQYVPYLEKAGWRVTHRPNFPSRYWEAPPLAPRWRSRLRKWAKRLGKLSRRRDIFDAARHDVVFLNRDLWGGEVQWEQRLLRSNPRVIFDFDDAIFLGPERENHIGWICRHAAWVTAGNEHLAAFARRFTDRVTVLPTVVEVVRYAPADPPSASVPVRVGWMGSDLSIRETLFPHLAMLGRLQRRLDFDFVVVSRPRRELPPDGGLRWRFVEWSPAVEENIARHIDIGLMPLVDDEFQRGKCGLKLLQYMAAALPVVASPIGVNRHIVQPGRTGFLAATEAEWHDALAALIASPALRREMGMNARVFCAEHYSLEAWLPKMLQLFDRVASGRFTGSPNQ
jgi:glycosyltransferase involved in cell wall biosynthesis